MSAWPTIEWLATRTGAADIAVPREEAEAIMREMKRLKAQQQVFLRAIYCAGCGLDYTKHPKREDGAPLDPTVPNGECGHWMFYHSAHPVLTNAGLPAGPGGRKRASTNGS